MDDQDVLFLIDDEPGSSRSADGDPWTIAIIDDDAAVHDGTRFALYDYSLNDRGLRILSAYSAAEGRQLLAAEPGIAVLLLDVVMETDTAGLELVDFVRKQLKNKTVRIVLRTGQPGQAPERQVILDYDINDYKAKTELTADKLFTTLTAALRSYEQLRCLTETRRGLETIVDAAESFFDLPSVEQLAEDVFLRLEAVLQGPCAGVLVARDAGSPDGASVLAATGPYRDLVGKELRRTDPVIRQRLMAALDAGKTELLDSRFVLFLPTGSGREVVIFGEPERPLTDVDRELLGLLTGHLSLAFDNATLYARLQEANQRLEDRVLQRTSELQKANQRLGAQRATLRRANALKNEMLGTVAHDLKNPLGVILGRAEILSDLLDMSPLPLDPMRAQLGHIRDSAKRLTGMVDDLMRQAINDALDISIRADPLDFASLVADVVAANRPLAERKDQQLTLRGVTHLSLTGDPERLREAIDNVVGNAVKYTPIGGTIEVVVALEPEGAICSVRDDGPGLPPEDLARVFGRFQRLSAKPTGGEGSTGLGLSIVKRIVELHGGQARAESPGPGLGSTFSLILPVAKAEPQ